MSTRLLMDRRYRVADIAVGRDSDIGTGIPMVAPFLAIEIVSPEDQNPTIDIPLSRAFHLNA